MDISLCHSGTSTVVSAAGRLLLQIHCPSRPGPHFSRQQLLTTWVKCFFIFVFMNCDLWDAFPELDMIIKVPLLMATEVSFVGIPGHTSQLEALAELSMLSTRSGGDRSMGFDYLD